MWRCTGLLSIVVLSALIISSAPSPLRGAGDAALLDAKRKAANGLVTQGKFKDAEQILLEIVAADATQYQDHVLLAHVYEKLGDSKKQAEEYQQVVNLVPANTKDNSARRARLDASKRIKILDTQSTEIDTLEADFLKKLDAIERDAAKSDNVVSLARVARLRGGIWHAEGRTDRVVVDISAERGFMDTGLITTAGKTYIIRALGTWTADGVVCNATGTKGKDISPSGPPGRLVGAIGQGNQFPIGGEAQFVAASNGHLSLGINGNLSGTKAGFSGSLVVEIAEQP